MKGKIKEKNFKKLKEEMLKRHERDPMDKKLKALKVCFLKIIHEN